VLDGDVDRAHGTPGVATVDTPVRRASWFDLDDLEARAGRRAGRTGAHPDCRLPKLGRNVAALCF